MRALGKFVVNFALPALLFRALSQRSVIESDDRRHHRWLPRGTGAAALLATTVASVVTISTALWVMSTLLGWGP